MNILFIEDKKGQAATGISQLELNGYTVFSAYDISEAQAILDDPKRTVHFIITDHRLPDGLGIPFLLEMKESFPHCKCAVVSGCLTEKDIKELESHKIPYYAEPLLYAHVTDDLRRIYASQAAEHPDPEVTLEVSEEVLPDGDEKKKGFGFWPFN